MAQVKLETHGLADGVVITSARLIHTSLTGNATYPHPTPPLVDFLALIDDADAKLTEYEAARQTAEMLREEKDVAIAALLAGMSTEASYVQTASGGDAALIMSAGMQVRNPAAPITEVGQVLNLQVTANSLAGALRARWKKVHGAKSYQIEISTDPMSANTWTQYDAVSASNARLTGLTSVTRVWVRVRAVGARGIKGAWSDPALKTVP